MNFKKISLIMIISLLIIGIFLNQFVDNKREKTKKINGTILSMKNDSITLQDKNNIIYKFKEKDIDALAGDKIVIEYAGILDKNKENQNAKIINYKVTSSIMKEDTLEDYLDDGIFKDYYLLAYNKLKNLNINEKIGQLFLVRYPDEKSIEDLKKYKFSGYLFYEKNFKNKDKYEVISMINNLQSSSDIPLLTAVDEEGGRVVRISSNLNLVEEKFKSPKELYELGGFNRIRQDTIDKSNILYNLGINLNLAPVVDVSTNSSDYIYDRTIGENTLITSNYAKTVIEASKGLGVSYTLKHFPGYSNNTDTHTSSSVDTRSYNDILENDLPPFKKGIEAGAEAVLVSHNTVNSIDPNNPASLSASVHNLLRNNLDFTGVIVTDDLSMGAISSISNPAVKALLAGNDLIITTNYEDDINDVKQALSSGEIDESLINKLAFKILAWKYYKGIMYDNEK